MRQRVSLTSMITRRRTRPIPIGATRNMLSNRRSLMSARLRSEISLITQRLPVASPTDEPSGEHSIRTQNSEDPLRSILTSQVCGMPVLLKRVRKSS